MKDIYQFIDECVLKARQAKEKTMFHETVTKKFEIVFDFETFRDYYYETSPMVAQRMAVSNGVSYAQTQIWIARLKHDVNHLAFN